MIKQRADVLLELLQDKTRWQLCQEIALVEEQRNDLERKIEAAERACSWVSVSERLPKPDEWVLVNNGKWTGVGKFTSNTDGRFDASEVWQSETGEFIEHIGPQVTDWMPLPATPKPKRVKRA